MKLLIDSFSTVNQVQKSLALLDGKQKILAIIEALSWKIEKEEIFQFLEIELRELPTEIITADVVPVFQLKKAHIQSVRDLATDVLDLLNSKQLADNFGNLIELVKSPSFFIREEAIRLISKMIPEDLFNYFDDIVTLRNSGDLDLRRVYKKLIGKIANNWPIERIKSHASYVSELQQDIDPDLQELGDLLMLKIMETWGFDYDKFKMLLPFFKKCNDYNNVDINERAAWFAWRILSEAPASDRLINVAYLTNFNDCGHKIIRRMYRSLALDTLDMVDDCQLENFANFLIDCLESSNKDDQAKAWTLLLKIDPDKLPLDYLMFKCDSDFWFVKYKYRFLLKRISSQALASQLDVLFGSLRSDSHKVQKRAFKLLSRIDHEQLKKHRDYLEEQAGKKNIYVNNIAKYLLLSLN